MKVSQASLSPGDTIEISVTHEIKIKGDKTWVGTRAATTVREDETYTKAAERLDAVVQEVIVAEVQRTVEMTEKEFYS